MDFALPPPAIPLHLSQKLPRPHHSTGCRSIEAAETVSITSVMVAADLIPNSKCQRDWASNLQLLFCWGELSHVVWEFERPSAAVSLGRTVSCRVCPNRGHRPVAFLLGPNLKTALVEGLSGGNATCSTAHNTGHAATPSFVHVSVPRYLEDTILTRRRATTTPTDITTCIAGAEQTLNPTPQPSGLRTRG